MFRQPLESFVRLETVEDENTLIGKDGSLISFVKVDGARQLIGATEYQRIIEQATIKIGSRFDQQGYGLQVFFMRNPDRIQGELEMMMQPAKNAARAIGLELEDLFEEKIRHLSPYLASEDMHYVLWTRPTSLTKPEMERELKDKKKLKWFYALRSQYPFAGFEGLRIRHKSYVSGVTAALQELGQQNRLLNCHEALQAVRASMYPSRNHSNWRANLPGDPIPPRELKGSGMDVSNLLWPSIAEQLCIADGEVIDNTTVRIDDLLWAGLDMVLGPTNPSPFPMLLSRLTESRIPFRISFLIEGGGISGTFIKRFSASVLGFTNGDNKLIMKSLAALEDISRHEPVVRLRINLATWAPKDNLRLLQDRLANLTNSVESWGYCQVSQLAGDPMECVMSSALGLACASTAPAAIAPLAEAIKLLPWQRPSSPFTNGPILFRSPDGRVWPYMTGSSLTTTWFDLIFAQPGAGKSVLMNALSLGTCITPGNSTLPHIAIIDIGPSSSGLISLLRDALPHHRRFEAAHYRLRMAPEYAVNPFDTQLGCRNPLPDERSYLVELLTLLATAPGQSKPYDGIPQLAGLVVDEMYRWRSDEGAAAEPRPYLPLIDHDVDDAIRTYNLRVAKDTYWWDIVDMLFDVGCIHEAMLAQRHAVPVLTDSVVAARRPQIRALLEETRIEASSESVINAFERMIASAIREYSIISNVTQFDISDAKICALDLGEVCPQGDESADRQTAIMYMLARYTLVRNWWLGSDIMHLVPQRFRQYHEKRLQGIKEAPKRLCYDEFHRTSHSRSVRQQVVRDVREGRKWGVQVVLSSQLLEDFDEDMVDLATGVWILGSAISDKSVKKTAEQFGLSETATWVMRNRLTGPRASGAPALLVLATNEGRYEQYLINSLGPIELWALSTSAEDVAIRNRLYARLGAAEARRVLAAHFPGGSGRQEIRRRVVQRTESGEMESSATSAVIEDIVQELIQFTMNKAHERIEAARRSQKNAS